MKIIKMKSHKPILLIEDDRIDALAVKRAFKAIQVTNPLDIAENGELALNHLKSGQRPMPCIILLDLNMPRMGGIELLHHLKADPRLKRIPVVVLTASGAEQDKNTCFSLGVAGYMIKPVDFNQFIDVVKTIDQYWTLSELPEGDWGHE